jgi:hypothetical protein
LAFFIPYFPTAIPLVFTEGIFLLVFTDGFEDENSVGKGHLNIPMEKFYRRLHLYLLVL